jgi:hypothetical protein
MAFVIPVRVRHHGGGNFARYRRGDLGFPAVRNGSDSKRACQHLFRGQHLYHIGGLASRAGLARPESNRCHVGPVDLRLDNRGHV